MSLTDTINNTNKQKENAKTVATQIDNKLVELGGERATDLFDVPNKMEGMVGQYKNFAQGTYNSYLKGKNIYKPGGPDAVFEKTVIMPLNLNFNPKYIFLSAKYIGYDISTAITNVTISNLNNFDKETSIGEEKEREDLKIGRVYVKSISKEKVELKFILFQSLNYSSGNEELRIQGPIEWIAIG